MNKKLLFVLSGILLSLSIPAQEKRISSNLHEVTVYRSSAREYRKAEAQVSAGQSELIISEIPLSMQDASLQVSVQGNADLVSAQVRTQYIPEGSGGGTETRTALWIDSLRSMERELRWITEEKSIINDEIGLLDFLSKQVDAASGYKPSNIRESVEYYSERSRLIRKRNLDLILKEEELNERRATLQMELESSTTIRTRTVKEIVLRFASDQTSQLDIAVSYLCASAGWLPFYDVRVKDTSSPVDLTARARIFQTTGYDWKNVQLTISTIEPGTNNNRPVLRPQYIDYVTYRFPSVETNQNFGVSNMMQVERIDPASIKGGIAGAKKNDPPSLLPDFSFDPAEKDITEEYTLDKKMTVASDGREHLCELFRKDLPATYRYHAVPKLDPSAFLLARITDFGSMPLLAGDANVFYGDAYIGQVSFNPRTVQDTMLVSLGRDERIMIKRIRVNARESKKILSDKEEEIFTYETTIRNNKKIPVEIEILDQIPLSRKEEITVELLSKDRADYNKTFGKLMWTLKIPPGQSKKISFSYSVTSPEGKPVEELR